MWLLNVNSRRLEAFINSTSVVGGYAILSHTWEEEEVTFDDINGSNAPAMKGYRKIDLTCRQALRDGLKYAWIDTCCIDKRSSAELSEAINSMYRWYYDARVCYAFLSDVALEHHIDILELPQAESPVELSLVYSSLSATGCGTTILEGQENTNSEQKHDSGLDRVPVSGDGRSADATYDTRLPRRLSTGFWKDVEDVFSLRNDWRGVRLDLQDQAGHRTSRKSSSSQRHPNFYGRELAANALKQGSLRTSPRSTADDVSEVSRQTPVDGLIHLHGPSLPPLNTMAETGLRNCFAPSRWFSRGWTLQELIAPSRVEFFDSKWLFIGTRDEHVDSLSEVTGIDPAVLRDRTHLSQISIGQRMSWAASRKTTREEDIAYCLLGIFDVNMPLLYGEGKRAFIRLQEEIIRSHDFVDHSILAWSGSNGDLLAHSPAKFLSKHKLYTWRLPQRQAFELSNNGLRATLYVLPHKVHTKYGSREYDVDNAPTLTAVLNCCDEHSRSTHLALKLHLRPRVEVISRNGYASTASEAAAHAEELIYDRSSSLRTVENHEIGLYTRRTLTIARTPWTWPTWRNKVHITTDCILDIDRRYHRKISPGINSFFDQRNGILTLPDLEDGLDLIISGHYGTIEETFWINLKRDVSNIPELRVSNQHNHYSTAPLQRGVERTLSKDNRKIFKVVANVIAFEGEFLWDIEVTASVLHEVEAEPVTRVVHELSADETRKEILATPVFEDLRHDVSAVENASPEEMQRQDPLGTQMWRLYSKTKGQLPNSERLQNLSRRMMSMNLRRRELERQSSKS